MALGLDFREYLKENPIYLTSSQIKEMALEGFTIGGHTMSHPKLVQVSEKDMKAEIVESCRVVQGITGAGVVPFAFPNTATGIDRKTLAEIRYRNPFLGLFPHLYENLFPNPQHNIFSFLLFLPLF